MSGIFICERAALLYFCIELGADAHTTTIT